MMQDVLFDDVPYPCPECGEEWDTKSAADRCCYVNEDCPDGCNDDHPTEPDQFDGTFVCPATGNRYRYCTVCGWESDPYYVGSTYIHGEWFCEPYEHEWDCCSECGEWVDAGCIIWSERDECGYCSDCYRESAHHETAPELRCAHCRVTLTAATVIFDPVAEVRTCTAHANPKDLPRVA